MKNTISSFVKEFIKVVIIVAIAVPTIALFAAWTGPTGVPPTNNADAPVNVGIATQQKNGNLAVNSFRSFYDTYLATNGGNVGIGTVSPTAKLDVAGDIKITDGTQGDGKVLTSDADGKASWEASTGDAQGGKAWGGAKYINDGTEINCDILTDFFGGGTINFYAKAENSKVFIRILRNNSSDFNIDTGWVNELEINGITYQNGIQDNRIISRAQSGYLQGILSGYEIEVPINCRADWP